MNDLALAQKMRLDLMNFAGIERQGASTTIVLERLTEDTIQSRTLATLTGRTWSKRSKTDGLGITTEWFEVAIDQLTAAQWREVRSVVHEGYRYHITKPKESPRELNQVWRLEIISIEAV